MSEQMNWEALRRDLDWDNPARQREADRVLLQQRARQYAALLQTTTSDASAMTVLSFQLGKEHYALDALLVQAVRAVTRITPVPGAPYFFPGVVNLRGQITTVLDLRRFFDLSTDEKQLPSELIVVRANQLEIGVLAHHVEGVGTLLSNQVEPLPEMRYTRGVTVDGRVILDIAGLFEDERLMVGSTEDRK